MPGLLLTGPAGGGKTQLARELLSQFDRPGVVADFQIHTGSALLLLVRNDDTGRYPERLASQDYALSIAEYVRRAIITAAEEREIEVIVTSFGRLTRPSQLPARATRPWQLRSESLTQGGQS